MEFNTYFKNDIANGTLLGEYKSQSLFKYLKQTEHLQGSTAEIGVYEGRTSKLIHSFTPHKTHYCYDTFCGIIGADSSVDKHVDGEFNCPLDKVKSIINMDNVIYKVGFFPSTFNEYDEVFSFVHSDTDTYIGTKETINYFASRMATNGIILFDDYAWVNCPGVEKAIHEFIQTDKNFIHIPSPQTNQFILIKRALPIN